MEKDLTQNESLIKRVVICGPESTGKSTLTVKLASYFNTNYVGEYARENTNITNSNKLIFSDTNILTTIAWSKTHFDGFCDPWLIRQSKLLKYDYYLILNTDTPWTKDDLRDRPNDRKKMFSAHKEELKLCHVNFDIITGSDFEERFQQAIDQSSHDIA